MVNRCASSIVWSGFIVAVEGAQDIADSPNALLPAVLPAVKDGNPLFYALPGGLNLGDSFDIGYDVTPESPYTLSLTPVPVPEPSTYLLFAVGILGTIGLGYRQQKKAA